MTIKIKTIIKIDIWNEQYNFAITVQVSACSDFAYIKKFQLWASYVMAK